MTSEASATLRRGAASQFAVLGIGLALAVQPLVGAVGQRVALALYGAIAAVALCGLGHHAPHRRFGAANAVTAARAAAAAALLGAWGEWAFGVPDAPAARWLLVAIGAAALAADGLDGWLARRRGQVSDFGARFDMETDALLVLALALLVHASGQAGAFVLLSGALRYGYVAAGKFVPALRAVLPASLRRKLVCVIQTVLLLAALAPPILPAAGQVLAGAGLMLLIYSFAADIRWCFRASVVPL